MNLFELQERLKDFSQEQLVNEMQAPTGTAPQYLVLSELQRRQRMMMEEQAQMPQDQTTVAQDAVAAAGVPQAGLSGMAQAMAPRTDMDMNTGVAPVERMQAGGMVGGMGSDPLAPYAQYLDQTYLKPKIQSFVGNVKNMEQQTFGAPMGGGGFMGPPAQPGGMQMAAFNAAQARNPAPTALNPADPYDGMRGFGSPAFGMYSGPPVPALGGAQASQPAATRNFGASLFGSGLAGGLGMASPYFQMAAGSSRMADGGVVRMNQGGLAGISRDLGAYSPTMGGARAIMPTPETDALRRYLSAYRAAIAGQNIGRKSASRPLETDPLDPRSGREPSLEELSAALGAMDAPDLGMATLSGDLDPRFYPVDGALGAGEGREPVAPSIVDRITGSELGRLLAAGSGVTIPQMSAEPIDPMQGPNLPRSPFFGSIDNITGVGDLEFGGVVTEPMEVDVIPPATPPDAIIPLTPDDDTTRPAPRPDRETSTPPRGPSGTGVIGGAPAVDDAFEQDKWLALAQAGLALMSSQQPTFGGALGEAGLTGISALRTARGERDARIAAAQARADRLAAAAAAAAEERPASYEDKAVRDLLTQRERLFQEASSYVDDLGMIAPGYEGRYERLIKNIDAIDTMVSAATMSRFPGLMKSLTEE